MNGFFLCGKEEEYLKSLGILWAKPEKRKLRNYQNLFDIGINYSLLINFYTSGILKELVS